MFDFHQKRKIRIIINSPYTQGVIILLACMVGWSAYVRYEIAMEMSDRRVLAEQQTAALEARKQSLEDQVKYLSSERGIETQVRRQFDVALPGEKVVVILEDVDGEKNIKPLSTSSKSAGKDKRWYQFWR